LLLEKKEKSRLKLINSFLVVKKEFDERIAIGLVRVAKMP
jgi:hypothetical protein